LSQSVRPLAHHPAVTTALRLFASPQPRSEQRRPEGDGDEYLARITQVAEASGVSRRWLTRVFAEEVGLTPKRFARVQRFLATLRRIGAQLGAQQRINWAQLALECGYYDQAHLSNEFRTFAGVCPSAYLRVRSAQSPYTLLSD
jgi:AraC-like DNA-binding protein